MSEKGSRSIGIFTLIRIMKELCHSDPICSDQVGIENLEDAIRRGIPRYVEDPCVEYVIKYFNENRRTFFRVLKFLLRYNLVYIREGNTWKGNCKLYRLTGKGVSLLYTLLQIFSLE